MAGKEETAQELYHRFLLGEGHTITGGILNVAMVKSNLELKDAIADLNDSTTKHQKTTNNLTKWIFGLTVAIAILTATQVALIVIQLVG